MMRASGPLSVETCSGSTQEPDGPPKAARGSSSSSSSSRSNQPRTRLSPCGRYVASIQSPRCVLLWSVDTAQASVALKGISGGPRQQTPSLPVILPKFPIQRSLSLSQPSQVHGELDVSAFRGHPTSATFSPDSSFLVIQSSMDALAVYQVQVMTPPPTHRNPGFSKAVVSPVGRRFSVSAVVEARFPAKP